MKRSSLKLICISSVVVLIGGCFHIYMKGYDTDKGEKETRMIRLLYYDVPCDHTQCHYKRVLMRQGQQLEDTSHKSAWLKSQQKSP